jgi:hypothetical protein
MTDSNKTKLAPTEELINQLRTTPYSRDGRTYRRLIDQIDWNLAAAEVLDRALSVTLSFADLRRAKQITALARQRFPENEIFARAWQLFDPPPVRWSKPRWQQPPDFLKHCMEWLDEHVYDYEVGHWLAMNDGQLVADAPTRQELDNLLASLKGKNPLAEHALIHQVLS